MGVAFTIGLILSILVFLLARRLVRPSYKEGYGSDRVTIPEERVKFPIIVWALYVLCTFIPIVNIVCPIVCFVIILCSLDEDDLEIKWGSFITSIINFFSKRL